MSPSRAENELVYGVGSQFDSSKDSRQFRMNTSSLQATVPESSPKDRPCQTRGAKLTTEALNLLNKQYTVPGLDVKMRAWMEDRHDYAAYKRSFGGAPKSGQPKDP